MENFNPFLFIWEIMQRLFHLVSIVQGFLSYEFRIPAPIGIDVSMLGVLGGVGFTVLMIAIILKYIVPFL